MIGRVETIGKGGRGIVFYDGRPVFIDGVLKGELVEFEIARKKHSVSFAAPVKIIESSKSRVTPSCPYYHRCGGCNFQHIAYPEQIAIKQDILRSNLERIAKIDYPHPVEVISSPPFRYRSRAILKIEEGRVGFYEKESHDVVEFETCLLLPQIVEDFVKELRDGPLIKNVKKGEIFILSNGRELSALLKTDDASARLPGEKPQPAAVAGRSTYLGDKQTLSFTIGEFVYSFSPANFIQANLFTLEAMTRLVQENLSKDRFERAVDLFCGAGFFTPVLARRAGRVRAVESGKRNIRALKVNLAANNIDNVEISRADILKTSVPGADCYVIDPPRTGLNKKVVSAIAANSPRKIIYFSCDSATFSRDVSYFRDSGYMIKELKIIDNFPQTDHFEIFSCLRRPAF